MQHATWGAGLGKCPVPDAPAVAPLESDAGATPGVTSGVPVIGIGGSAGALEALNLLNSTQIATLFLDGELRVKFFTPATTQVLKLIPSDTGRPINDLSLNFVDYDLTADARSVAQGGPVLERDAWHAGGSCYRVRVMPYLAQDNRADGVVVTFDDVTARRQTEEALRESRALLQAVTDRLPDAVFLKDAQSRIVMANPATLRIIGRSLDEVIGKDDNEHYADPEVGRAIMANDRRIMESGVTETVEEVGLTPDGYRTFLSTKLPWRDAEGRVIGLLGITRDITERKRAEEALRASAQRERERAEELAVLFESVPIPVFIARDPDCLHLTGNRLADEILRIPHGHELSMTGPAETKPQHFRVFKDGRELRLDELPAQRSARGERVKDFEFSITFDDGMVRHVMGYGTPLLDDQGRPRGTVAVLVDITNRKRMEEAQRKQAADMLRLSEQEFYSLAEAMPQIVWATRPDGWNIYFNQQWVDYTGMTMEESYGHGWNKPFHPDDQQRAWDAWQRATKHNEPYSLECRLQRADGAYRWWLVRGAPMRGASGEILKWFGTCTDIEEIKRAEAALQEANELLAQRVAERTTALRESEERFRFALQNAPVSVATQDGNLVYQWAYNQRTHRPDEIVGKTDADLFAPEDVPTILETKRRVIESGTPVHVAHWLTSNGQRVFLDLHYEPLRNPAGEITGIGIAAVDMTEQKRTEEALRQSRNQFRVLTQNVDAGVALVDEHGRFAIVNPVFLRLFDLPDDSSIKNVNDCDWAKWQVFEENGELVPVDEHPVRKAALTNRAVRDRLVGVKTPSGAALKWMLISAEPILRADGHMEALICTYLDITERRKAEEALRQSQQDLNRAQAVANMGWWRLDTHTNVLTWSPENHRIFGVPEGTAMSYEFFLSTVHPEDRQYVGTRWAAALSGEPYDIEHRILIGGQVKWLREKAYLEFDGDCKLVGGFGITQDITERKRAQADLDRMRVMLAEGQRVAHVGSWEYLADTQTTVWSEEEFRLFGLDPAAGAPPYDVLLAKHIHPDDAAALHETFAAALRNREVYEQEHRIVRPDGSVRVLYDRALPCFDERGDLVKYMGASLDITERKQAEEALRGSLRDKEVLLKEVHHRVKNNMQVLASLVSLQADAVGDPATRALFDDFRDQVRTMAQVHESLYQSENLTSIAFDEFANGLTTNLARTHGRGDAAIRLTLDVEPVTLPIESAVPCGLILNELVTNAYKHAFRGRDAGEIVVRLRADAAGRVCLGVYDNGVGLPAGLDWRQSTSLGLRLVQILARQVRGEFDIRVEKGTAVQLAFTPPALKA